MPLTRTYRHLLLLVSAFIATGVIWDAVQIFAWGNMWWTNIQTQSVRDSVVTTFSNEGMCGLCHTVQSAKKQQQDAPEQLVYQADRIPLLVPAFAGQRCPAPPARRMAFLTSKSLRPVAAVRETPTPPPRVA